MEIGSTSPVEMPVPVTHGKAAREISRTWEAFLSSGELTGPRLRPVIAEGWRRCRELGIDPLMQRAPTALLSQDIGMVLAREDLGRAGRSVLEDFGRVVEGTGHVLVLADEQGRILQAAGHSRIQGALERVNLAPGGTLGKRKRPVSSEATVEIAWPRGSNKDTCAWLIGAPSAPRTWPLTTLSWSCACAPDASSETNRARTAARRTGHEPESLATGALVPAVGKGSSFIMLLLLGAR